MQYPTLDPSKEEGTVSATKAITETTGPLKLLSSPLILNLGTVIVLVAAVLVYILLSRTSLGYEMYAVGLNKDAAYANGINAERNMFLALLINGALAGLTGGIKVIGTIGKAINGFSVSYGFGGIPIALMAHNNPSAVIITALLMEGMCNGSLTMQSNMGVSENMVDIVQGLIVVFLCAGSVIRYYTKKRRGGK